MKILFISPLPPPKGGIARWTELVCDYASKEGDKVIIINTSAKHREVDGRTKVQRILNGVLRMIELMFELVRIIKLDRPDVVHISTSGSLAFIRDYVLLKYLKKHEIRSALHLHFGRIPAIKKKNSREWKLFLKDASIADSVIAMNLPTYEALDSVLEKHKRFNIPNPVDFSKLPEPLPYEAHDKYILYLGWIQSNKGAEELLQAWQQMKQKANGWTLKMVGPFNKEYFQGLADKGMCEDVEFTGEMSHSEAMDVMKKAGIFVLPSHSEGFPNVIIEAMALKVPVVATDVGAIPEMLDGNGIVVKPKDVHELAEALSKAIEDEEFRAQSSELVFERALNNYEISLVYKKYKQVWEH